MIKLLKLFGFGKKVKKTVKLTRTAVFADYGASLKTVSKKEIVMPLSYDYKAQIPVSYTTPEFKSYLSQSVLKKKKARKVKMKQLKAELKRQEEKAREMLFNKHEETVSKILYIDPKHLSKTSVVNEIKNLTDPDMCLELLDYNGYRLKPEGIPKYMSNTNNILLRQIGKGGKSIRRTNVLIERFKKEASQTTYSYPAEVKELVNSILHIGEESQLLGFLKILKKCAETDSYGKRDINRQVLLGVTKAVKNIQVPKEYCELGEIIIKQPNQTWIANDAAVELSYFKGKFNLIADFMKRNDKHGRDASRSEAVVSAGFRSAMKDGKLDEFREIVFNPENKYFPYMIENYYKARTHQEDLLFKKEITSKLLSDKFEPFLENYHISMLKKELNNSK